LENVDYQWMEQVIGKPWTVIGIWWLEIGLSFFNKLGKKSKLSKRLKVALEDTFRDKIL